MKFGFTQCLVLMCMFTLGACSDTGVSVGTSNSIRDEPSSTNELVTNAEITEAPTPEAPTSETPTSETPTSETPTSEQPELPAGLDETDGPLVPDPQLNTIESNAPIIVVPGNTVFAPTNSDIYDNRGFYDLNGYDTPNVIRVDIRTNTNAGICSVDDQSGCTLTDVLNDTDGTDNFKVDIPVHFSADDFVDDGSASNAELRQRGASSRQAVQKSFRIKLESKDVLWRNERRLQLNKHPYDRSRFRNKLSFDLMRELPHLPSLRTQFVNLWIDNGAGPVDHGLYTHVEAAVKEYLVNREWDKDDNLYKANQFFFSPADLSEMEIDENGEPMHIDRFEARLEIKRGDSHIQLLSMINALNDPSQAFDSVFNRYFNANNVLMWITTNFLLGQKDVSSQNFYLFNPKGSEKFYFLPWDYDAAITPESELVNSLNREALRSRLSFGYSRFTDSIFMSRYLAEPGAHQRILNAADELRNVYLTDDIISYRAEQYAQIVRPYISRSPDIENLAGVRELSNISVYDDSVQSMPDYIDNNMQSLKNDFGVPMPPFLKQPIVGDTQVILQWLPAFSLTGGSLYYDVQLSSSPKFESDNVVANFSKVGDRTRLVQQAVDRELLAEGEWYFRVVARDELQPERLWNIAKNEIKVDGITEYGIRVFTVP